jgi:tripartite-type tricarboxylate transporter receptor subunit TctC
MLRGIFMPPGVEQAHVDFYVDLLNAVVQTPDWKAFMEQGAFNQTVMTGSTYRGWLEAADKQHFELMKAAGFLAEGK